MEVLISLVVLSLVMVAVMAVGFTTVSRVNTDSVERQKDATTAQWSAMAFARDVQGASGVSDPECGATAGGTRLVTLVQSETGAQVEYRRSDAAPFELVRVDCTSGEHRVVVRDLEVCPFVEFAMPPGTPTTTSVSTTTTSMVPGACPAPPTVPTTPPRRVALRMGRTESFGFELDGARRLSNTVNDPPTVPALEAPSFVSIGGGTPLRVTGDSELRVVGNAFINKPPTGTVAVNIHGSASLDVSGIFALQDPGECPNCASRANKVPTSFTQRLPDPLRFLPAPDTSTLALQTDCPVQAGVRVCEPGIYEVTFPPAGGGGGGGVKNFELRPGTYVLRNGMKVTNGSIVDAPRGGATSGVLIYNEIGAVDVTGADIDLAPASTGIYAGILYFQARTNPADFKLSGNSVVASIDSPDALAGTIYVPLSGDVILGGGGGTLRVGRVVGTSLQTFGNGTVIVDGE